MANNDSPILETAKIESINPYGTTKIVVEKLLNDVYSSSSDEWSISSLRYFNPIGAHKSGMIGELPLGKPENLVPFLTQTAIGKRAYEIPISSTKSMTGHLLGGSGGIEAVACVLSIKHALIPPTINYSKPDPDCDLDYVPNNARNSKSNVVLSNSFGFGGHNVCLAFRKMT